MIALMWWAFEQKFVVRRDEHVCPLCAMRIDTLYCNYCNNNSQ